MLDHESSLWRRNIVCVKIGDVVKVSARLVPNANFIPEIAKPGYIPDVVNPGQFPAIPAYQYCPKALVIERDPNHSTSFLLMFQDGSLERWNSTWFRMISCSSSDNTV